MKWSSYNKFIKLNNTKHLLYNSLSNCLIELDEEDYKELLFIKSNVNSMSEKEINNDLLKSKIIVTDDELEILKIREKSIQRRFNQSYYTITVAPTLDCNLGCSYCFEDSVKPVYINREVKQNFISFLKSNSSIKHLQIVWYGGEPLLAFNDMLDITSMIKDINISYSSIIISNGTMLNKEVIKQLDFLKTVSIQITFDGVKRTHDLIRNLKYGEEGTFDKIINNIDDLVRYKNDIKLTFRININKFNQEEYKDIYLYLSKRYSNSNIYIYPGFIRPLSGFACSNKIKNYDELKHSCFYSHNEKAQFYIKQFKNYKLKQNYYPSLSENECMALCSNRFLLSPSGDIYKCWEDIGKKNRIIGNINGDIYNEDLYIKYMMASDPFDDPKCKKCFYLPICGGGCPVARLRQKYYDSKEDTCTRFKGNLDKFIKIHYSLMKKSYLTE